MLFVGTCVSPLAYDEPCWEVIKTDSKGNTTFCRYESFTVLDWYKEVFKYGKEFFLVR